MKGLKQRITKVWKVLTNDEVPKKPVILNDVNLEEFKVKMDDLIDNYIYFNQDRNIVKSSELLSEIMIYVLLTANRSGLEDIFEQITKMVCDDVIEGTQQDEVGHRIPLVTQGNHKVIDLGTKKVETHNDHSDNLIYRTMGSENEDLRF